MYPQLLSFLNSVDPEIYQPVLESQECENGRLKTHIKLYCKVAGCEEQELFILGPEGSCGE